MFLQNRIPAADVLPDHDHAELSRNAEDVGWLAGALATVARAKGHGGTVGEELEDKLLRRAEIVHVWLGRLIGAETEVPLVEAIDLLCRRSGSGGVSTQDF